MDQGYDRYHPDMDSIHQGFRIEPCLVCRMVAGDGRLPKNIFYEDEGAFAFLEGYPRVYGYSLVLPGRSQGAPSR
jgi:hypothetical protein